MPNTDRIDQVRLLANAVSFFLPPPARAPIADKLYQLGVRIVPEIASSELVEEGSENLGNWTPRYLQKIRGDDPLEMVRQFNPELADRFAAASTDEERAVLREELRRKHGSQIADLEKRIALAKPEDLM